MLNRTKPIVRLIIYSFGFMTQQSNHTNAKADKLYLRQLQNTSPLSFLNPIFNYAYSNRVCHTQGILAAKFAVELVECSLRWFLAVLKQVGNKILLTATHCIVLMVDPVTAQPHITTTINQVPLMSACGETLLIPKGSLFGLASIMSAILGLEQPVEMAGKSLLKTA